MHPARWAPIFLAVFLLSRGGAAEGLVWTDGHGFRSAAVQPIGSGKPGFTLMGAEVTGVSFTNELRGDLSLTNVVAHNGSGLAIGDVDGDGWADIFLCGLQGPNRLYRNLGNWRFEEVELGAAACSNELSTGAVLADVDADRDLDLLVNGISAGTRLFLNNGNGDWKERRDSGLSRTNSATSMALADIDGDGDLDLYCTHYINVMYLSDPTMRFDTAQRGNRWEVTRVNGEPADLPRWRGRFEAMANGRVREIPESDGFYRNDGNGFFTPIQNEPGLFLDAKGQPMPPPRDWGLAVMFRDINGDGSPDLFVCNDNESPDRFWTNTGKGRFQAMNAIAVRHTSRSSMGIDFADIDRDGHDDFIVLDMLARDHRRRQMQFTRNFLDAAEETGAEQPSFNRNMLFLGRAGGTFAEAAFMAGVAATDWSWCPIFLDVDLDGYEDLLVSNGFEQDVLDQDTTAQLRHRKLSQSQLKRYRQFFPSWPTSNAAFRNRGDGTFESIEHAWGFDLVGVSQGMAAGDLDNDGDLDLVLNNLNSAASLYRNNSGEPRIAVRLAGSGKNAHGAGAGICLLGGPFEQSQEMILGGRYLSGDQALRVFAAKTILEKSLRLEVRWRNGRVSTVSNAEPNRVYEITEAFSRSPTKPAKKTAVAPIFRDVSSMLGHMHVEQPFDDWTRQPGLPRRFSRLGPGLSWYDFNADGWEDLLITTGRGGKLAIFANEEGRKFNYFESSEVARAAQAAVIGFSDGDGNSRFVVATSKFDQPPGQESRITLFSSTAPPQEFPAGRASIGPLAAADVNGDGRLDLFVGGRHLPGRYPEAAPSMLWLNMKGELRPTAALSEPFRAAGLVSGATFSDLDGDGDPDLALAVEWGPVRVFKNENGKFDDSTVALGLEGHKGWWTSVTAGDFDGDGRMDLAAGNWGRNSAYELHQTSPLRAYFNDWDTNGTVELIEAWRQRTHWFPIRNRDFLASAFPDLAQRFPLHANWAMATVADALGPRIESAKILEVNDLSSAIFLNRGTRFERVPLPREAQMAPAFAVNVADFDGDGLEDLFVSQNFFGAASGLNRDDAGRGLWLRGEGDGRFTTVDADSSGIKAYGEQRAAGLADFNHDGRVDLALTQNHGATRLFLNAGGKRGLRVTLRGPEANPEGIGAQMCVIYRNGKKGPVREVRAGSGYWSQDAAAQVLGLADAPAAVWVRWPGEKEQRFAVKDGDWQVRAAFSN